MPVVWTSDTEARLLAGFFRVMEIKVGKKELEELAEIIGPECTAKAVSHRIQKYKTMAAQFKGNKKDGEADQADDDGPVTPKKKGTPGKKGGKSGKKRAVAEEANGEEQGDGKEEVVAKKVKVEAGTGEDFDPDFI